MRRSGPGLGIGACWLVVVCAVGAALATDVPFSSKKVVSSSVTDPSRVALADVDRDGDLDLLVAGRTPGEIAWFENQDGNGAFATKHLVTSLAAGVSAVTVADLDRDGWLDVVYTSDTDVVHVAWVRNLGGGTFDAGASGRLLVSNSTQSQGARSIAVADVDKDGDPDLLVAAETSSKVLWYRNPGAPAGGTFTELVVSSAAGGPRSAVFADVDRDGDPDVFVASATGVTFSWYENKGNDSFAAQQAIWTSTDGRAVAAGDLNRDGEVDVVAASCADNTIAWFANDDNADPLDKPGESFPQRRVISSAAACPAALALADLDLDGDPDVVVAPRGGALRWYENLDGAGNFGAERLLPGAPAGAADVVVADLDVDGDLDVAAAATTGNEASFWSNRTIHRSGLFRAADLAPIAQARRYAAVALADTNRDGRLDVITSAEDRVTSLFLNNGGGTFRPEALLDSAPFAIRRLGTGDIDRDGDPDVVLAGDELTWLDNDPAQATWTRRQIDNAPQPKRFDAIAVIDVDRDGRNDVLSGGVHLSSGEGFLNFYRNTPGSGNGVNWDLRTIATSVGTTYAAVAARDVDGDGQRDVVVGGSRSNGGFLAWFRNGGAAGFGAERPIAQPAAAVRAIVLADLDLDGDLDVAYAGDDGAFYEANLDGAGGTWERRTIDPALPGRSLVVADVDNDGDPDLGLGNDAGALRFLENRDGAGRSWRTLPIQDGAPVAALAAGDVDREGDADLVFASGQTLTAWFPNRGGQVTLGGRDVAPAVSWSGLPSPMVAATVQLNARLGDSVGKLRSLTVQLLDGAGQPLTTAQAAGALTSLRVYRDDGSNTFDATRDVLVARAAPAASATGLQTIALPAADASARIAAPATFWIALEFADAAGGGQYALRYLASSTVVIDGNADRDIVLTQEPAADVSSSVTRVRVPLRVNGFADEPDAVPGNGECRSIGGSCTLRAAVQEANATAQPDLLLVPAGEFRLTIAGTDDTAAAGDLDLAGEVTIQGAGAGKTLVTGQLGIRAFQALGASNVTLQGLSFRGGGAEAPANTGGCLSNTGGVLKVLDSDFSGCTASVAGGAFADTAGAVTTLDRCSLYRNEAPNGSAAFTSGAITLKNTTVSSNRATGSGTIGTLAVAAGTLTGSSATIAGNNAVGVALQGGAASLANTVVALNTGGDLAGAVSLDRCFVSTASGDPRLGALGDNDGPTYTHAPLPGSPLLDAGLCPGNAVDQRGFPRPVDVPALANAGDACDIGAVEATIGQAALRIEIPVRWCAVRGAPSIENPTLVGALTPNDVVRARHEAATENVFEPLANIRWRSAGNFVVEDIPLLEDPDCTAGAGGGYTCAHGQRGDVFIDPEANNFDEFQQLIAQCRAAWQAQDPRITGITAVQINRFVAADGTPLEVLGLGGRAAPGDRAQQEAAGRVMVVDGSYRRTASPPDTIERLLAHELGHALSLEHGDGLDNETNGYIDDNDDQYAFKPRFDGPNVMQYRTGTELTPGQVNRMRTHALLTVPDLYLEPPADMLTNGAPIDPGIGKVLDFGFGKVLDFGFGKILDFGFGKVLDFGFGKVLDFGFGKVLDFEYANVQDMGIGKVLDFGFGKVLDFGMDFGSGDAAGTATLYTSTAGLPWSPPIRPESTYAFYLDLDENDATGGTPALLGFPPPPAGQESGVDVIAQVRLWSTCPDQVCYDYAELKVFDYDDATGTYALVYTQQDPALTAVTTGLFTDNSGATPELEDVPIGLNVRPSIPLPLLTGAIPGHTFNPGDPVRMQVVTTVDCSRRVVNDDPTSDLVNCVCTSCASCPGYPGCTGTTGTPLAPADPDNVVVDAAQGRLEFESPQLPACTTDPSIAAIGEPVTVTVTELPTDVTGTVEVAQGRTQLSTAPSSSIDPQGTVTIPVVPLPANELGVVTLSAGLVGYAPRAQCEVTIDPNRKCRDTDSDDICDYVDTDDDNDGVADAQDQKPLDRFVCRDTDHDSCDDCSTGVSNVADDGPDYDNDGQCDAGDPDDDNDTVPDAQDAAPQNAYACRDADADTCDDCSVAGAPAPGNDGADADADGVCNAGDPDDDGDGVLDAGDSAPLDRYRCADADADTCDDCSTGTSNVADDGPDQDADGLCNAGDPDDDNDLVPDAQDAAPLDAHACRDADADTCDDCSVTGSATPANDGTDTDHDGLCDAGDADADNDGVPNAQDCRPLLADVGICNDGNPCTDDTCNPTGATACSFTPAVGRSCSDGNACTTNDACTAAGTCGGGAPLNCNDGNACTTDSCDATLGCVALPIVNCDGLAPSLAVTVTPNPSSLTVGDQGADVTFTLAVRNTSAATDPVTLTALGDSLYGNLVSGVVNAKLKSTTCTLAAIAPASTYSCQYVVHKDPSAPGTETNTVTASGTDDDGLSASAAGSATVTILPSSSMTDSSFCFFDRDKGTAGRQFRVEYTNDPGAMPQYKISSSNPGQFFYTMFLKGTPGQDVQVSITLPWPFVTQSSSALKIYDGVDTYTDSKSGDTCYRPKSLVESRALTVTLANYTTRGYSGGTAATTTVPSFTVRMPATGFLALRLHLDYGLEGPKTDGNNDGKPDRYTQAANDDALPSGTTALAVPEGANHVFSFSATGGATGGDSDAIRNDNQFKGSSGVQGTVEFDDGFETPAANVLVELWGPSGFAGSARTDANGVYVINYKNPNKQATYDVYTRTNPSTPNAPPGTGDGCYRKQSTTLKTNSYAEVNFLDETDLGPNPATCVPPPAP